MNLYPHQETISSKACKTLRDHGLVYLSMQVRTGKTMTALAAAEKFGATRVLFVTKKKAISSIEGDYELMCKNALASFGLTVINYESLHKIKGDFDLVIVDEAHNLGAFPKPSQRSRRVKKRVGKTPCILMSGTPSPESYSQLFHQFFVSAWSPWKEYKSFYQWERAGYVSKWQRMINGYPVNDYSKANKKKVWQDIRHLFISYTQKEAGFKNEVIENVLRVKFPGDIHSYYTSMDDEDVFFYGDKEAIASNAGDRMNKLSQLSGGSLIFNEDKSGDILTTVKADYIKRWFDAGEYTKIAILYKYKAEFKLLKQTFPNWTDQPEDFNSQKDCVFLGQIRSVQEGVNLKSADALVMYNISFSATSYWQSRARLQNIERDKPARVYWVFSDLGIEDYVYKAVKAKKKFTNSYYQRVAKRRY